jgi:hypothetical protein
MAIASHSCHQARLHFYSFIICGIFAGQRLNHAILATTEPQL